MLNENTTLLSESEFVYLHVLEEDFAEGLVLRKDNSKYLAFINGRDIPVTIGKPMISLFSRGEFAKSTTHIVQFRFESSKGIPSYYYFLYVNNESGVDTILLVDKDFGDLLQKAATKTGSYVEQENSEIFDVGDIVFHSKGELTAFVETLFSQIDNLDSLPKGVAVPIVFRHDIENVTKQLSSLLNRTQKTHCTETSFGSQCKFADQEELILSSLFVLRDQAAARQFLLGALYSAAADSSKNDLALRLLIEMTTRGDKLAYTLSNRVLQGPASKPISEWRLNRSYLERALQRGYL